MDKKNLNINGTEFVIYTNSTVFGDGEHESTAKILEMMSKQDLKDKDVLDVGSGTGILSVYASLQGAKVTAVDLNPSALEFTRKNLEANGVDGVVSLNDLTQDIVKKFDVIVANLPAAEQVENVKDVDLCLKDDGVIIISWLNKLKPERHFRNLKVTEYIKNEEYDVYALKK